MASANFAISKSETLRMLEVCKKCIEIFILLKTIEKPFEMYDFLQSRSRTGGVAKIEIRILAAVARTFFVLPAMRGDHNLYKFRKSQLILDLGRACAPNPFSCQVRFSRPPLRKCTLFLLDDSSVGMGTTFFHQNHRNSFGVTNSNMKTLARSKNYNFH